MSCVINDDEKGIELIDRYFIGVCREFGDYIENLKGLFRSNWKMMGVIEEDTNVDHWDWIFEEFLEHERWLFRISSNLGVYEE